MRKEGEGAFFLGRGREKKETTRHWKCRKGGQVEDNEEKILEISNNGKFLQNYLSCCMYCRIF